MVRKRVPPLRFCADPECGHKWRGWSLSCPRCAPLARDGESLREFRRRVIEAPKDAA